MRRIKTPYIKKEERDGAFEKPTNAGKLNYCLSLIIHNYLTRKGIRYEHLNTVIGVLECMKLELYRQIAAPYEDIKKKENGSVSKLDNDSHSSTTN